MEKVILRDAGRVIYRDMSVGFRVCSCFPAVAISRTYSDAPNSDHACRNKLLYLCFMRLKIMLGFGENSLIVVVPHTI